LSPDNLFDFLLCDAESSRTGEDAFVLRAGLDGAGSLGAAVSVDFPFLALVDLVKVKPSICSSYTKWRE